MTGTHGADALSEEHLNWAGNNATGENSDGDVSRNLSAGTNRGQSRGARTRRIGRRITPCTAPRPARRPPPRLNRCFPCAIPLHLQGVGRYEKASRPRSPTRACHAAFRTARRDRHLVADDACHGDHQRRPALQKLPAKRQRAHQPRAPTRCSTVIPPASLGSGNPPSSLGEAISCSGTVSARVSAAAVRGLCRSSTCEPTQTMQSRSRRSRGSLCVGLRVPPTDRIPRPIQRRPGRSPRRQHVVRA